MSQIKALMESANKQSYSLTCHQNRHLLRSHCTLSLFLFFEASLCYVNVKRQHVLKNGIQTQFNNPLLMSTLTKQHFCSMLCSVSG